MLKEVYVSTDIETNGPIPGDFSMLSFASVAFDKVGREIDTFYSNLEELEGAKEDPDTMAWWAKNPEPFKATLSNKEKPAEAMKRYYEWLLQLPGKPVFVGYPAGFDFLFVYWYLMHFVGKSPFSFSAIDIKTLAMAYLKTPYILSTKRNMPKWWFNKNLKHTHNALDDAREQGFLFFSILKDLAF